jgi:hypothetical protein
VRKLNCDCEDLQISYSQPVRELLSLAIGQLMLLTRVEKLPHLMGRLAFIYFSFEVLLPLSSCLLLSSASL